LAALPARAAAASHGAADGETAARQRDAASPDVGVPLALLGHRRIAADIRVAEDLETRMVMVGQQREHEPADRVLAKIGGDVADPKAAIRISVVGMRETKTSKRCDELLVELLVLFVQLARAEVGVKMQGVEQVSRRGGRRREGMGLAI